MAIDVSGNGRVRIPRDPEDDYTAEQAADRRRFVEEGLEASLRERPRPGARPKLGPKEQALVVALACTQPPEGRFRWTMQLLAERVVELEIVPAITDEAIRRLLKRPSSSRGSRSSG